MNSRVYSRMFCLAALFALLLGSTTLWSQNPQLLPYQTTLLAGTTSTSATYAAGAACPVSGKTMTDAYGDGCLATEVVLSSPKYITADGSGNVYFSDNGHLLIRRIDATTGIITTVAGGGTLAKPSSTVSDNGTACPSGNGSAVDFQGDGCLATDVQLLAPAGVAVSPLTGDVYFTDTSLYTIRRIDHATGIIHNVLGYLASNKPAYGYYANTASLTYGITDPLVSLSGPSALHYPYGIRFDTAGNLYIAEESYDAVLVLNTSSATTTVAGVSIPAGTVAKVAGYRSQTPASNYCPNGISGTIGCAYGNWTSGASANASLNDNPYDVTFDGAGNIYFANEYNSTVGQITPSGILNTWAGKQTTPSSASAITNSRGVANTMLFGSNFGIAADNDGNVYIPDSVKGWIWRVDAVTQAMWVYAGAGTPCTTGNTYGDGCPYTQTAFKPGTVSGGYASKPGISGMFIAGDGSLLIADTVDNLLHKIATNANFGTIQPTNPMQTLALHFPVGDGFSSAQLTTATYNFTLATPTCATNSDTTVDCLLAVTATPTAKGTFSSNLQVISKNGKAGNFTLSGNLELDQKASTTAVTLSTSTTNPVTPVTITATVSNSFNSPNTGSVEFYSNNGTNTVDLGSGTLSGGQASITQTLAAGSYSIYATYAGNLFLLPSQSQAVQLQSVIPTFSVTPTQAGTSIGQGQTAINAFTITTAGSYTGTLTFACSGLPANATCTFSPSSLTVANEAYDTVTLNISTVGAMSAAVPPAPLGKHSATALALLVPGGAVLLFAVRRRKHAAWFVLVLAAALGITGLSGCNKAVATVQATPAGSYTVTVTATGTPNVVAPSTSITKTAVMTLTVTNY